jgi:hypothetical protein
VLPMKKFWCGLAILACSVPILGCRANRMPVTRDSLVGTYVSVSEDPDDTVSNHNLDQLVLRPDGTYDLVEGGTTKPPAKTSGNWTLWTGGHNCPRVLLGHSGYPVRFAQKQVRLLVDDDVGIWWAKLKSN